MLSISEVERYFTSDEYRKCEPTFYAVDEGVIARSDNGCSKWWLRTTGLNSSAFAYIAYVNSVGEIDMSGVYADSDNTAVRPAMWIDLSE